MCVVQHGQVERAGLRRDGVNGDGIPAGLLSPAGMECELHQYVWAASLCSDKAGGGVLGRVLCCM